MNIKIEYISLKRFGLNKKIKKNSTLFQQHYLLYKNFTKRYLNLYMYILRKKKSLGMDTHSTAITFLEVKQWSINPFISSLNNPHSALQLQIEGCTACSYCPHSNTPR